MTQLIKTKDKFILVSDEKGKAGKNFNFALNKIDNLSRDYEEHSSEWNFCRKIISENPDFSLLSEEDCKTIGWVDVEKLADKEISCSDNIDVKLVKEVWKAGFRTAQSLNDKMFSLEDMRNMFILGGKHKVQNPDIFLDKMEEILQSLQQTEWDVDVEKLADEKAPIDSQENPAYPNFTDTDIFVYGFKEGFKTAQSLNDKMFSLEDMKEALLLCCEKHRAGYNSHYDVDYQETDVIIQSLQQTSWDVEVEMEYIHDDTVPYPKTKGERPKITNNSIKVIKIL